MRRSQFLRTLGVGAAMISGSSHLIGEGHAAGASAALGETDVYPTGQYPFDVEEVQAAVNGGIGPSGRTYPGGGVVRLKATSAGGAPMYFNFGGTYPPVLPTDRGSAKIARDVTVVGESTGPSSLPAFPNDPVPDPDYAPDRTVIYGGKRAFSCPADNPTATKVTIRNVYFAYPSLAAVQVRKSAGLEVSDCVIYSVKLDATGLGFSVANGIEATGVALASPELVGDFRVINNRIRRAVPTTSPVNFFAVDSGIVMNLSNMNGQIVANEIDRFTFTGIGIDRNNGPVTIAGNTTSRCGFGSNPMSCGIGARGTAAPIFIQRNLVIGGYAGALQSLPSKNGLALASSNAVLQANAVEGLMSLNGVLLTTFAAGGTTYFATNNRVERNRLRARGRQDAGAC